MNTTGKTVDRLARRAGRTEADVQADVRSLLMSPELNVGEDDLEEVMLEAQVGGGKRIDVETGYTVIEVKRDIRNPQVVDEAVKQLQGYVLARSAATYQRYVGVLTDGAIWILYHEVNGQLRRVSEFALRGDSSDENALTTWLEGVLATREEIVPTPHEVEYRLGAHSSSFKLDLADLTSLYASTRDQPEVQLKRELWARLLASAFGTNFDDSDELFIEHSYLVLVAELVAHAVVGFDLASPDFTGYGLVSGETFRQAQIGGVVEADFFDWPAATIGGDQLVKTIARRLARFNWNAVEHDVLKVLYESVIDSETRHRLGEYYTPDWLAERMVSDVVEHPIEQVVLDPACGSGTFLFWAVRRFLHEAEEREVDVRTALEDLTNHVLGVDLHPVAVTLARVTYLLAIGSDRLQNHPPFSVPVYLGDSVRWEEDDSLLAGGGIVVYTSDGAELFARELRFPAGVIEDAGRFDLLVSDLADRAANRSPGSTPPDINGLLNRHGVHEDDREQIRITLDQLCQLHDDGRDHIWGYYIRNLARPAWISRHKVDVLVGNPPWLSYRFMGDHMQGIFRTLSKQRGLWAGAQVATHQDLSSLFVVRAIEQYLRDGGRFAFVMPAAALSRRQFAGFRAGDFASPVAMTRATFEQPWDLTFIRPEPFPVPCCVIRGSSTPVEARSMPREAIAWSGQLDPDTHRWSDVEKRIDMTPAKIVVAGDDPTSPYVSHFAQGATIVPRVLTIVERTAAGPLGAVAGNSQIRSRRSTVEKKPWRSLDSLSGAVEEQFLRRAYFGASILPFRCAEPELFALPWIQDRIIGEDDPALDRYPGIAEWWRAASRIWSENRADKSPPTLRERIDFHNGLSAQLPATPLRVVYTGAGEKLAAAILRDRDAVVNSDLYWSAVATESEARYLTAILNSRALLERVAPYQSRGQFGRRHFHKYVFAIPFPIFRSTDLLHAQIADAGGTAEEIAASVAIPSESGFQKARRIVRTELQADGISEVIERFVDELLSS